MFHGAILLCVVRCINNTSYYVDGSQMSKTRSRRAAPNEVYFVLCLKYVPLQHFCDSKIRSEISSLKDKKKGEDKDN